MVRSWDKDCWRDGLCCWMRDTPGESCGSTLGIGMDDDIDSAVGDDSDWGGDCEDSVDGGGLTNGEECGVKEKQDASVGSEMMLEMDSRELMPNAVLNDDPVSNFILVTAESTGYNQS